MSWVRQLLLTMVTQKHIALDLVPHTNFLSPIHQQAHGDINIIPTENPPASRVQTVHNSKRMFIVQNPPPKNSYNLVKWLSCFRDNIICTCPIIGIVMADHITGNV